jgi:integrase/recombinase XerD
MPPLLDVCLIRPLAGATETPVLGVALLDEYLRFVASRCRPNTVLAAAYDLKVSSPWSANSPRRWDPRMCWRS